MPLSFYTLTYNSEKYLDIILKRVQEVADEIIVVDSGSKDKTKTITLNYTNKFLVRTFDNFISQRKYAIDNCTHQWVLSLDSDEIPDKDFIETLKDLKRENFHASSGVDGYTAKYYWYVLNKKIHSIYPICSPRNQVILFNKNKAHFNGSSLVHPTLMGLDQIKNIEKGAIAHRTFENPEEFRVKLERYTNLAAIDAKNKGKKGNPLNAFIHACAAFIKWYFLKEGYKDGVIGIKTGHYAFLYTYKKYIKLMEITRRPTP